jgi:hypothetical protein
MQSNNPPDVILELTKQQAEFLLKNCNSNITMGLKLIDMPDVSRGTLERAVALMEEFKAIRAMLVTQGITDD